MVSLSKISESLGRALPWKKGGEEEKAAPVPAPQAPAAPAYVEALSRFIAGAQMPLTIAVQDEWGRGEDSLMNALARRSCANWKELGEARGEAFEENEAIASGPYLGVWVSAAQYAVLRGGRDAPGALIEGVARELSAQMNRLLGTAAAVKETGRKLLGSFGDLALSAAKLGASAGLAFAASKIGVKAPDIGSVGKESAAGEDEGASPGYFRSKLAESVAMYLAEYGRAHPEAPARGILFFIDELDRLDPAAAVQALSLLKSLFEVPSSVFVLAIDPETVSQGFAALSGGSGEKAEREAKAFFDAVVQHSFRVPVETGRVAEYLRKKLAASGFCDAADLADPAFLGVLSALTVASCGKSLRAIRQMLNALSLAREFHRVSPTELEKKDERLFLQILFALVCVRSCSPALYEEIRRRPDLGEWVPQGGEGQEPQAFALPEALLADPAVRRREKALRGLLQSLRGFAAAAGSATGQSPAGALLSVIEGNRRAAGEAGPEEEA